MITSSHTILSLEPVGSLLAQSTIIQTQKIDPRIAIMPILHIRMEKTLKAIISMSFFSLSIIHNQKLILQHLFISIYDRERNRWYNLKHCMMSCEGSPPLILRVDGRYLVMARDFW